MNCLLAKVKTGTRTPIFRKILSNKEIYAQDERRGIRTDKWRRYVRNGGVRENTYSRLMNRLHRFPIDLIKA